MKILTVDIGTGTQDIYLYDSNLDIENGFKLVLPSPTMMIHRRLKRMLPSRIPILLTGHQMGGGPSAWAIDTPSGTAARPGSTSTVNGDAWCGSPHVTPHRAWWGSARTPMRSGW